MKIYLTGFPMEQGWETLHSKVVRESPYGRPNADSEIGVKVVQ